MTTTTATTTSTQLPTGTWNIDPSHSSIEFSVRHLMISKVKGSFKTFSGTVTVPEDPLPGVGPRHHRPHLDRHRRRHPRRSTCGRPTSSRSRSTRWPSTCSTAVRPEGDGYVVDGELTLHGVTRPVALDLEFNGVGGDPWGNTRAGFTATAEINRRDFGIDITMPLETGGVVVGDKIKLSHRRRAGPRRFAKPTSPATEADRHPPVGLRRVRAATGTGPAPGGSRRWRSG